MTDHKQEVQKGAERCTPTAAELEGRSKELTRWQVSNLVDLRTMLHSRQAACRNNVQAEIYAMAAAAIELGLAEKCGVTLTDSPGGTTWERADERKETGGD